MTHPDSDRPATTGESAAPEGERILKAREERYLHDLRWLVAVRWIAVGGMLSTVTFVDRVLEALPWPAYLYGSAALLAVANFVFWLDLRRFSYLPQRVLYRRARMQAGVDIVILVVSVHLGGGVENPFIFLLVFHVAMFSVLFSQRDSLALATFAWVLVAVLMLSEQIGVPPFAHANLRGLVPPDLHASPWYRVGVLASLALTLYFTSFLVVRVCRQFHREHTALEETCRVLRLHKQELERTTLEVRKLLGAVEANGQFDVRYENPNLERCWEVKACGEEQCPVYGTSKQRCWNVAARLCAHNKDAPPGELKCPTCEVYRLARPDQLTEIGESFNSVMELLQKHVAQAEDLRTQALQQEKLAVMGQMAAGIAHEVGNPLASISSLVQYLEHQCKDEKQKESLRLVLSHVKRISDTVQDMSRFVRPAMTTEELVDLGALAEEALHLLSYDRRMKQIDVEFVREDARLPVKVPPKQVLQVFMNLLLNAADAMPEGGKLQIRTSRQDALASVEIADSGVGMPDDVRERIFEPFFTTKPLGRGTGLGLTLSNSTVRRYGGTISVRTAEGRGTTFTVSFPLQPAGNLSPKGIA